MPIPLTTVFADLPDPRMETANKLHQLVDILVVATCQLSAGRRLEEIAEYGRAKEDFFDDFSTYPMAFLATTPSNASSSNSHPMPSRIGSVGG